MNAEIIGIEEIKKMKANRFLVLGRVLIVISVLLDKKKTYIYDSLLMIIHISTDYQ
jgi:hypothetical protein